MASLESSYQKGLLDRAKAQELQSEDVPGYVSLLPGNARIESVQSYLKRRDSETSSDEEYVMDILFVILQVLNIVFNLSERLLQLESLSANDLCVVFDGESESLPTVTCHMLSVKKTYMDYGLTCEKLRMFVIQLCHMSDRLPKSATFQKVDDLLSNSSDQGDLKTIALIIQYLLWGPKAEEVKIMSVAESRKQAFELWLQLARAKLLNRLASKKMDKLKVYMISNFLVNTSGPELFKITKLLTTY